MLIEEDECNLTEYIDVPKVLGDLFETLIGAIYLDSGQSLTKVWEIVYSFMHKEIGKCIYIYVSALSNLSSNQKLIIRLKKKQKLPFSFNFMYYVLSFFKLRF